METVNSSKKMNTKTMVKVSVLGAIAAVLMFFDISTWFAPPFLKLDISDIPALIGGFSMGPAAGVLVQLVKNIVKFVLKGSSTGGVGEISNFVVGSIFTYTAALVYYRNKNFKNAIIGLVAGSLLMTLVATMSNYYIMFPLYSKLLNLPLDQIVEMGSAVNSRVVDLKSLIVFAVVPFNLLKSFITSLITILIYKKVSPILHD